MSASLPPPPCGLTQAELKELKCFDLSTLRCGAVYEDGEGKERECKRPFTAHPKGNIVQTFNQFDNECIGVGVGGGLSQGPSGKFSSLVRFTLFDAIY